MLAIGSAVTTPDGEHGIVLSEGNKLYVIHGDGVDANIQVFAVLLEDGEVRHYRREALASFGSAEEIRRSDNPTP